MAGKAFFEFSSEAHEALEKLIHLLANHFQINMSDFGSISLTPSMVSINESFNSGCQIAAPTFQQSFQIDAGVFVVECILNQDN